MLGCVAVGHTADLTFGGAELPPVAVLGDVTADDDKASTFGFSGTGFGGGM